MAIYLKLDGVEGEVTTKGYEKQIELLSFSFGANRNIRTARRDENNRESDEPNISEVSLVKQWGSTSSPKLFEESVAGKLNHTATLTFTTTSDGSVEKYLEIKLENAGVSNFRMSDGGGDKPTESFGLNFARIFYKPFTIDNKKNAQAGVGVMYDLAKMSAKP